MNRKKGTLYWITGLSGAGKTTLGTLLYEYLKKKKDNVFFMDGDKIREVYQNKDYTEEGRTKLAYQNMRLCRMMTDQGIDVICATIAMKDEYREWNRINIENYIELYLEVPINVLIQRDAKGLYKRALAREITNVYGIDMDYEAPKTPDMIIRNDGTKTPQQICEHIVKKFDL